MRSYSRGLLAVLVPLAIIAASPSLAGASSANISRAYKLRGSLPTGSLVSLNPGLSEYVEAANTKNSKLLVGVIVSPEDSLLALDQSETKVQVATSGTVSALVSNMNGDIKVGDQVSVSPFNGVGAKAIEGAYVLGLAQTDFNSRTAGTQSRTVTDLSGHKRQIVVGFTRVIVTVGPPSNGLGQQNVLNSLQQVVKNLTGHTVSTTRIVLSLAVAVVTILALVTLIYGSIYGSIISIGRNPLAKYTIFRTLGGVLLMALLLAGVAVATVFALLR